MGTSMAYGMGHPHVNSHEKVAVGRGFYFYSESMSTTIKG